jgi:hypothetical protein
LLTTYARSASSERLLARGDEAGEAGLAHSAIRPDWLVLLRCERSTQVVEGRSSERRHLKATVAANRAYPSVEALAERASAWLSSLEADRVLRPAGLHTRKFDWLPT